MGLGPVALAASSTLPQSVTLSAGWQLQDAAKVTQAGDAIASTNFKPQSWYSATVPGTVLTSLVNAGAYPEPLYGENNRPDKIPDSLARTPYWYRTVFEVPETYAGKHVWLNLEGINFSAQVWVNGTQVGTMKGAFKRGIFDISAEAKPGKKAVLAVLVSPQPHPGDPHEHTIRDGVGRNGGITAIDGPTFLSTIGWDWIPAIRDRDTGIWQKVFLSASGPVVIKDPLVTTDLPLPKTDAADVSVQARVENVTDAPQKGVLKGTFGDVTFEQSVEVAAHSSQTVTVDSKNTPAMHVANPKLWWPNGYGPQNLYKLHLSFEVDGKTSDDKDVSFGVRKFTYAVPDSENLTISVNGVRVFIRGGNWGLDEAMKRNPRERLEAQIRMHQIANMNMIRNWVGQSTSEDFYELCDKYGILVWDEFFQPNPSDGPDPDDFDTYMANVRDKILRFRNHAAIVLWCARNEGYPPKKIDDALRVLMTELEPTRLYQANSADGRGVNSHGPYHWRTPREFYVYDEAFKTEIGSVSVPTLESIHGMMPEKDWETINDDWAEHDFAKGAADGDKYPAMIADRYGKVANLADFVRKSQLANYEAFRAMYEGRNAKLFHPTTGVITWMSNPAQPSFVWQIYHHDLEPNSALFAVKKAAEPVHIQLNESNGEVQVINNLNTTLEGAHAHLAIYNLNGAVKYEHDFDVTASPSLATTLGSVAWPADLSTVHFVKLELRDAAGKLVSDNFYWRALPEHQDDLKALDSLSTIALDAKVSRSDADGRSLITVTLHNPDKEVALMTHLQLRRKRSGERVLPVYYSDNYVSLLPNESKTITIEAATADLKGEGALVVVDGWNGRVVAGSAAGVGIETNGEALVEHWPVTGLPMISATQ
ncbi:glycoside hydrolase family 2 protein [Tunturiibacter gelidoferens]|uniref:Beta-galactosidase/beta-glucuronidase n=1 Tax=Tunturiibacter lichenicola TaxID=2051959 RepID=A0A7Y9T896_9BACT|nr:glycoside hydrolase family 2 TIM barrel-domain containing protein [Edaphobacter lichenicola]NYF50310.1 beta-galactosidase/beta-glucuronidase [Edaphobacter lichenicola]